jgi:hypothetical protein
LLVVVLRHLCCSGTSLCVLEIVRLCGHAFMCSMFLLVCTMHDCLLQCDVGASDGGGGLAILLSSYGLLSQTTMQLTNVAASTNTVSNATGLLCLRCSCLCLVVQGASRAVVTHAAHCQFLWPRGCRGWWGCSTPLRIYHRHCVEPGGISSSQHVDQQLR